MPGAWSSTRRDLPDLRLAGAALGTWLAAFGALSLSARTTVVVAGVAAVAAGVAAATVSHAGGRPLAWGWVAVAVLLGVVCGATATAARTSVRDAEPLAGLARGRAAVVAELVVRDDPQLMPGVRPRWLVVADVRRLTVDGVAGTTEIRLAASVVVLATNEAWRGLLPGQRVIAAGRLLPPQRGDLRAAALSTSQPPRRVGEAPWVQRAAGTLRAGLQRACAPLPDRPGGLLPGLVVGDTSRLDPAVADDFRATGMTHLVAVSGANVAIVIGCVLLLARGIRAGPRLTATVCAAALAGFVVLARPSPSVLRAAAMGALGVVALASGRPRAAVPGLCAAIVVLVVVDPELAGDPGFALSVLATGGLLLIAPRWRDALRARGVPAGVAEALAIPAAAQLACAPVIAGLSGTVSLVAVPANLLAVPAIAPATVLGVVAAVVSPVWPTGAQFAAWLAGWPAAWLVAVAGHGARLPGGTLPWLGGWAGALLLAGVTVAFLVAARRRHVRRLAAVVAVAAVVGALPVGLVGGGWAPAGWLMVVCSVGQGDAVVLPTVPGAAVVVDAGPDPGPIDGCLRRLGVRTVPLLVVTHFHADHVGGIDGVLRGRGVAAIVTTAWPEPVVGQESVARAAAARRIPLGVAPVGWSDTLGGLTLTVIGPPRPIVGTRSDPNNNSLVLHVRQRGVDLLLAGDAENEEQQALLDRVGPGGLRAAVLKVAHHGSAYQEPAFLDAVDPAIAMVSVGVHNLYGHPNASVLGKLARDGARVLRTDRDGDLAAARTGGRLAVAARGYGPGGHPP
jgi:competence protein ComEC